VSDTTVTAGAGVLSSEDAHELATHLSEFPEHRFAKYHLHAPGGPPLVAIAHDGEGRAIGMGAFHRRRLVVDGEPAVVAVAGDFVVAPRHRTVGLALRIQRALLELAEEDGVQLVLGEPNERARGVFSRLGYEPFAQRQTYIRFFGQGREASRARHRVAYAGVRALDAVLAAVGPEQWLRRRGTRWATGFDERFEPLLALATERGVVGERTAELLNWRYELDGRHGTGRYALLAHERRGVVDAYVVFARTPHVWYAKEVIGTDVRATGAVMAEAVALGRAAGVSGLAVPVFAWPESLGRALVSLQFVRRPSSRWLFARGGNGSAPAWARDPAGWSFFSGDLDP
jgi:predicted N-acetyltransferase YhbS